MRNLPHEMKASLRVHRRSVAAIHRPARRASIISRVDSFEDLKQLPHISGGSAKGVLHTAEVSSTQRTSWKVYWQFVRTVSIRVTVLVMLTNAASTAFSVAAGIWLSEWAEDSNITHADGKVNDEKRNLRLGVYAGLGALQGGEC